MATSRHSHDLIGGRYRLESTIASGGMADVWRATDLQLGRVVAVKLLKQSVANDVVVAERFRREARALARLTHPNVVPVYDCIEEHGQVALIMRLIEGKSLRHLLDESGSGEQPAQLSVHTTVHIGRSIAAALAKAHSENIVHRDIKPANILVQPDGNVLLTDFGIAKPLKATEDDGTDLTRVDIMMGTAKYLSPEQVQGRPLDARADIYSLGLVMYECLAGHVPFKEDNDQATAVARLQRDPTPLGGIRTDVPSTVINVIHKMLRRRPENRFTSCTEVVDALDEAMNHLHDAVTPPTGMNPSLEASPTARLRPNSIDPLMPTKQQRVLHAVPDRDNTPERMDREQKDRTPKGTARSRASLPATQRTSTKRNYIPVVFLLVAALIMSFMLWKGLQNTRSNSGTTAVIDNIKVGPVSVQNVRSYDPNGDDGIENEDMIPALLDNNPATTWTTVCYGDKYFGSKGGLGILLSLTGVGIGTLTANFVNGPWSAEVFVSTADTAPTGLNDWGLRVADASSETPGIGKFTVEQPARNVLLVLRRIGTSSTCSNTNPYKGVLSDINFTSAK